MNEAVCSETLDFHGDMYDVVPRRLWQVLFDHYRSRGGDLLTMDNMLIDFDNCKEWRDRLSQGIGNDFIFLFDDRDYHTSWRWRNQWRSGDARQLLTDSGCRYGVVVEACGDDPGSETFTVTLYEAQVMGEPTADD